MRKKKDICKETVIKMYSEGYGSYLIAAKLGVSSNTIKSRLKEYGVDTTGGSGRTGRKHELVDYGGGDVEKVLVCPGRQTRKLIRED